MKKIVTLLSLLFLPLLISACNSSSQQSGESITAVGSSALQPLVEAAGEQYQTEHLGVFINVQGGGSGTGLSQIQQGAVDIGNSDLFAEEKAGIKAKALVDHKVAVVGIAPIVNPKVGVKNVSMAQLQKIFLGEITNWQQLGGKNVPIVLVNRAQGSGTRATFEKCVMQGKQPMAAQEQDSTGMVRQIVGSTPGAISYVAFSYIDKTVQGLSVDGVAPTDANVTTNQWRIWSYEHMYTKGQPKGLTKKFLAYVMSPAIQKKLVLKMGYVPMTQMKVVRDANGKVSKQ
ncbi:phosphate ABC transporter substrate-binding protein PstS family protein [Lacticaseibacillus paracasei]|uniref:Phosphate-binding protein n=1 Tax=Lacticaseibacillus paracasei (strain ATCC 334 / BCRC 17002 / CCUG 31169 / CIP 107868 / KCTC 3260 / NRRL B-441) TaxID=321967 RepID=Q03AN7_LACP3|nr:phosphate ABC transporter substrate-binding protein PstS family protein [Lacticaseibacillus paracasei]ABJ69735.1 phosphate ABC transporter substrate-binding protein, PhoT family [Lacticaseibacillus paracasei ATCC 334]KRK16751.1 ABC-type phosphate transport system, periplasmic component [Lacticaseibacillus casei DSM 20011 = JCM 1134 = ATCC 393]OSY80360.1 phosphate ABC transporter substrate-binding protein [Lacticaseibacillus paracasei]RHX74729.1 phosphate ABC transporter substrate-binding pro